MSSSRPGLLQRLLRYCAIGHGDVDEPGPQVGLHDAVREAHAIPARLHEPELRAPGRGQPEVEGVPELVQPALELGQSAGCGGCRPAPAPASARTRRPRRRPATFPGAALAVEASSGAGEPSSSSNLT